MTKIQNLERPILKETLEIVFEDQRPRLSVSCLSMLTHVHPTCTPTHPRRTNEVVISLTSRMHAVLLSLATEEFVLCHGPLPGAHSILNALHIFSQLSLIITWQQLHLKGNEAEP